MDIIGGSVILYTKFIYNQKYEFSESRKIWTVQDKKYIFNNISYIELDG